MKKGLAVFSIALVMTGIASAARASSFTFEFDNKILIAGSVVTYSPVTSVGKLIIADSAANLNWVELTIEMYSGQGAANEYLFNFSGFPLLAGYQFVLVGDYAPQTLSDTTPANNDGDAAGYINHFDLDSTITDGAAFPKKKIYIATLKLQQIASPFAFADLNASMFNLTDDQGNYAYVSPISIEAGEVCPTCPTELIGSFNYVAKASVETSAVPEPGTIGLLGTGLIGLVILFRRRTSH